MKLFIFIFSFYSFCLQAFEVHQVAVVRDKNFRAKIQKVLIQDLVSPDHFEGKYFKIVHAKNSSPVSFSDSDELKLKAATVYYHLSKARDYFIDKLNSDYVASLPQLTIRLDLINVFNEIGHFANDNLDPQYNNALSIPAGKGSQSRGVDPWDMEIWFRPSKKINILELGGNPTAGLKQALKAFRNQTQLGNLDSFLKTFFQMNKYGAYDPATLMRLAGSSLILELLYQSSDFTAQFFNQNVYFLESALVPEIIYHEFAHIALSEKMLLTHSSPVNEGMADYFAGKIANSSQLATHIKDYNLFSGKKVRKKQQYRIEFESNELANTDFVFGLLWQIGETAGENNSEFFIYNMKNYLETSSSIKTDLINATLNTCRELCSQYGNDRFRFYQLFNSKNL